MAARKERKRGRGEGRRGEERRDDKTRSMHTLSSRAHPSDLLPPTRSHLLAFPSSPNSGINWGTRFQHVNFWGTFQIQTIIVCLKYIYMYRKLPKTYLWTTD
jgi:hypothetical protein